MQDFAMQKMKRPQENEVMLWDLDNTLRQGVAGWNMMPDVTPLRGSNLNVLVTNNAADLSITLEQVHRAGLTFIDDIWTPRILEQELTTSMHANDVFVSSLPTTFIDFVRLAYITGSGDTPGRIYCTEPNALLSNPHTMFECGDVPSSQTIWLPDVGACAQWLQRHARGSQWPVGEVPVIIDAGKSSDLAIASIKKLIDNHGRSGTVVGDSTADALLAKKIGFDFLLVSSSIT